MKLKFNFIFAWGLLACISCSKEQKLSNIPALEFISINTQEVEEGSSEDTVKIVLKFTDGNADIIIDDDSTNVKIFQTHDSETLNYPMPFIHEAFRDPDKGIEGLMTLTIPAAFLLMRDTSMKKDSLSFIISIHDKEGNWSNEITTPLVYITSK